MTSKPSVWTVRRVTVASLLAVTVSVTAGVTFQLAPVVVPCTAVVTYGLWYRGRTFKTPGPLVLFCVGWGAFVGASIAAMTFGFWAIFAGGEELWQLGLNALAIAALGAWTGSAYGFAFVLPILTQLSDPALRPTEGIDRCLISCGLWGVLALGVGFGLVTAFPGAARAAPGGASWITGASLALHGLMFSGGTLRWARRHAWLGRVLQGQVSGWHVCDAQRFARAELEGLQVFCNPVFKRPPANSLRVLAWGDGTDAYRSTPLAPKYWVA